MNVTDTRDLGTEQRLRVLLLCGTICLSSACDGLAANECEPGTLDCTCFDGRECADDLVCRLDRCRAMDARDEPGAQSVREDARVEVSQDAQPDPLRDERTPDGGPLDAGADASLDAKAPDGSSEPTDAATDALETADSGSTTDDACTDDDDCPDCYGCDADGECVPAPVHEDCGPCEYCHWPGGDCRPQPAGSDFKGDCDWTYCTSLLAGWDEEQQWCETYGGTLEGTNGSCDGAGACRTFEEICTDRTQAEGLRCDPGCARTDQCVAGANQSTADGVDERCFTDGLRHGCAEGQTCSAEGSCE